MRDNITYNTVYLLCIIDVLYVLLFECKKCDMKREICRIKCKIMRQKFTMMRKNIIHIILLMRY